PLRQSLISPIGCAISPFESCPSGVIIKSSLSGRCSSASSENVFAISLKIFQSLFACHGGDIAALNGCTKGCKSVLLKSNFSYHVAVGKTISENKPELVILKSTLTNKSVFPLGASSGTLTSSGCQDIF